jgi:hypothetical protein
MMANIYYYRKALTLNHTWKTGFKSALFLAGLFLSGLPAMGQTIVTYAGNNTVGYSGDGGPATAAQLNLPYYLATDLPGNVYIGDQGNHVVRMVSPSGSITTVAGNGGIGYTGDNGPATDATLNTFAGIAVDGAGNLYIADPNNVVIRKVDNTGIITTFAGNGTVGYTGDGGPATDAQLYGPSGVAVDNAGNVYFTEGVNSVVRMVDNTGVISTFAGNQALGGAYSGDGGQATDAGLGNPVGIAIDGAGNVYVSDRNNSVVRKIDPTGVISTFAGNGTPGYSGDNAAATNAQLNQPYQLSVDAAGDLFIADASNNVIRKVNTSGIISTYAGNGISGYNGDGGPAVSAQLANPTGVTVNTNNGNVYIADYLNNVVRLVTNTPPSYVFASPTSFQVCQDMAAPGYDFTALLVINDPDAGETEIWNVVSGPSNGIVTGVPDTAISDPLNPPTTPSKAVHYIPNAGFSGTDAITVVVNDGAGGSAAMTINITVNPTPVMAAVAPQVVCDGAPTMADTFTSNVPGTTFTWTNSDPTIGLAGSGSGDTLFSFTASNVTAAPVTAMISVTPTANTCAGTPQSFTITVNPTPDVSPVPTDQFVCNGDMTVADTFTSSVAGTTFTWTNDNIAIGVPGSGTDTLFSYPATNATNAPISGTITVTPSANGCPGTSSAFTITVKPTPTLSSTLTPAEICDSTLLHYEPLYNVAGTVGSWSRALVTNISNPAAAGTVDTINEVLNNTSVLPVGVVYVYTLTANGCTNTQNVTDTVNPKLLLTSSPTPPDVCSGELFSYSPTSATPGTTFTWDRGTISGISNTGVIGATGDVNEVLIDTTSAPVTVTYNYHVIYHACSNDQNVMVNVKPTPMLTSALTPATICDSTLFNYIPTYATAGTVGAWSRAAVSGISNAASVGVVDTINEILVDTMTFPVPVVYVYTLTANSCVNTQNVTVTVNPLPMLTSSLTPPGICNRDTFDYTSTTATLGTTFTWSRPSHTGITPTSSTGTGAHIHEALTNSTALPVTVIYVDTLNFSGCINVEQIQVMVNPTPVLSSLHSVAICDSQFFNYPPTSNTTGAAYAWSRAYVPGIAVAPAGGTNNPDEQLINTTNFNVNVVYVYTVSINGCGSTDSVTVTVHPTPLLSSSDTVAACSNAPFNYTAQSITPGTTFAWKRGHVNGITPSTAAGTGNVNETLIDTLLVPINTVYTYTLTANGCPHAENVLVNVLPAPGAPLIGIKSPASLCAGAQYMNFGAVTTPPTGTSYIWSAVNASVMATGANKQNSLVTFSNPGNAQVILTTSINSNSCKNADTFTVNVGSTTVTSPKVIYFNGQFIALQNDVKSYQWGYDDAITLDSTLIPGEVNQVYFIDNPDVTHRYYWLMTVQENNCLQKTYFNVPAGITNVNEDLVGIKVYPNPASSNLNVEINAAIGGHLQVEVLNLLGQKLNTTLMTDSKASIDVAGMPAGYYFVNCYRDGIKIGTAKFVKN